MEGAAVKILVTGSRDFTDADMVAKALWRAYVDLRPEGLISPDDVMVHHGAARGADTLAAEAARRFGFQVKPFHAYWSQGRGAGIRRNTHMVNSSWDAVVCLAFYQAGADNTGTQDCVRKAKDTGLNVVRYPRRDCDNCGGSGQDVTEVADGAYMPHDCGWCQGQGSIYTGPENMA